MASPHVWPLSNVRGPSTASERNVAKPDCVWLAFPLSHCQVRQEAAAEREAVAQYRIIVTETRGHPTGYLRAQSDTVEYDREQHELKGAREEHGTVLQSVFG